MKLSDIELHDANIESLSVDYAKRSAVVELRYYPKGSKSAERVRGRISFVGVEEMSGIANLMELSAHAKFGNISYWQPADGYGATYIYLCSGTLFVRAKKVLFKKMHNNSLQARRP